MTAPRLHCVAGVVTRSYQKRIKVSKAAMKCLDITGDQFHPEWNYTISPRHTAKL
jgi:hypothetical protein